MTEALQIGSVDIPDSLLYMLKFIQVRKYLILDTCCGCIRREESTDTQDNNKSCRTKGIKLQVTQADIQTKLPKIRLLPKEQFDSEQDGTVLNEKVIPESLPSNCIIISACSINECVIETDDGSMFTNIFLETLSRSYHPPKGIDNDIITHECPLSLNLADTIRLTTIIDKVNDLSFTTAVGLVKWGSQLTKQRKGISRFKSVASATGKIKKWLKTLSP